MPQTKLFVLDTNVLIHDPCAFKAFLNSRVIIPLTVIEELDKLKRASSQVGTHARAAIRALCEARETGSGDLHSGLTLSPDSSSSTVVQIVGSYAKDKALDGFCNDNKIILTAADFQRQGHNVILVSKDFAMRLKAESIGLPVEDYENQKASYESLIKELRSIPVTAEVFQKINAGDSCVLPVQNDHFNEYVLATYENNARLLRSGKDGVYGHLIEPKSLWGIAARNDAQKCAVDALMRDDIKLVSLIGQAGTGR